MRKLFARENGRDPKNPRDAESGDGCADSMHGTLPSSGFNSCACLPHKIATSGLFRETSCLIAYSVTASQPFPLCEAGAFGRTVRTLLRSITPCSHHGVRSPFFGAEMPISSDSSR